MKLSSLEDNLETRRIEKEIKNKSYLEPKSIWLRAWRIMFAEEKRRQSAKKYALKKIKPISGQKI